MGEKRVVIAVAWAILRATWDVLSEVVEYKEPGGDYFDRVKNEQTKIKLIGLLVRLGHGVGLKSMQAAV
jgi:hypothetical protein